jgi:predicted transcriptional regulator
MLTVQVKLSVEDIINSLSDLNANEVEKLQNAIVILKEEEEALQQAINEGLEDVKHGRLTPHDVVMKEIKAKYNYKA